MELACAPGVTAVRDSKNPNGPILMFDRTKVASLLASLRGDRLNG